MIRKKLRNAVLILAGACMLAGYRHLIRCGSGRSVEIRYVHQPGRILSLISLRKFPFRLPAGWSGKCGMSIGDSSITFYHLASRQAHLNDSGSNGGRLFTLALQRGLFFYEHRAQLHPSSAAGRAASITSPSPQDLQGYTNDSSVWSEWQDVSSQVDWVISHISIDPCKRELSRGGSGCKQPGFLRIQHRRGTAISYPTVPPGLCPLPNCPV